MTKTVVVTGITSGIGYCILTLLIKRGYQVFANVRNHDDLLIVRKRFSIQENRNLNLTVCDLEDINSLENWLKYDMKDTEVSVLINNAGAGINKPFEDLKLEDWKRIQDVNVTAPFLLSQWAFSSMKHKGNGGLLIHISSMASISGADKFKGFTAYTASKYALAGMSENIAVEGNPYGIHSICLSPGAIKTKMLDNMSPPIESALEPELIAEVVMDIVKVYPCIKYLSGTNIPLRHLQSFTGGT
ncbi:MAG: SDR family oxidoreductase [Bacillota bacterium]